MATPSEMTYGPHEPPPESLRALAGYLELSLDKAKCLVIMRQGKDAYSVYVGDPANDEEELIAIGSMAASIVDEILAFTHSGANQVTIGEQTYRFFRSFTHVAKVGAVVISAG